MAIPETVQNVNMTSKVPQDSVIKAREAGWHQKTSAFPYWTYPKVTHITN